MWEDPIVAEIRRIREEYAARFNYDLWAMYEDLKEQERKSGRKFVSYPPRRIPPGWSDFDARLLRAADELHNDAVISDATWAKLAERYDDKQLIEVCMVVGQYHLVSFTLNSLGVEREPGVEGLPSR